MKNKEVWIYRIATGLFSLLIGAGVIMYLFQYEQASESYIKLGFPIFIIYPLAIAKILGLVAIWTNKSKTLKEWAYAGFTFNLILAIGAHINVDDGEFFAAAMVLVFVGISYYFNNRLSTNRE